MQPALLQVDLTAFVAANISGEVSPALSVIDSSALIVHNLIENSSEARSFQFSRVENHTALDTLYGSVLNTDTLVLPQSASQSTNCVLIHGAAASLLMKRIFTNLAEKTLENVTESAAASASTRMSFSVMRVYSWGVTDVLRKAIIERNILTPPRMTHAESSGATPTGSLLNGMQGEKEIVYRPLDAATLAEEGMPLVRQVLRDALRVPDGHSAVVFTLVVDDAQCGHRRAFTVGLLPELKRANHLFRHDLLNLREVFHRRIPLLQSGDAVGRLAGLLLGRSPGATNRLRVVTIVDGSIPYSESNLLQCWYGSHVTTHPTPIWSIPPSPAMQSAVGGSPVRSPQSLLTTPHRSGIFEGGQEWRALESEFCMESSLMSATRRAARGTQDSELEGGDVYAPADHARLSSETTALQAAKTQLEGDIKSLLAYKAQLEGSIGAFFQSVGEEVLQELQGAQTEMLTEVARSQAILQLSHASSLAQEDELLTRLSVLASEVAQGTAPDGNKRTPPRGSGMSPRKVVH